MYLSIETGRQSGKTAFAEAHAEVIAARRAHIRAMARCESCGSTRAECDRYREDNTDPTAPDWFGCCSRPLMPDPRCRHVEQPGMIKLLLDEIESGAVRTIIEAYPPPKQGPLKPPMLWLLDQDEYWQPQHGPMVRIDAMADTHRLHTMRWLERRARSLGFIYSLSILSLGDPPDGVWAEMDRDAADPVGWLRRQPLYRALGRHLPSPRGGKRARKRYRRLLERAAHWSTCPRNRQISAEVCTCQPREADVSAALATGGSGLSV